MKYESEKEKTVLHRKSLLINITAVTLCFVGVALAKAVKQELVPEDGHVLGKANLNYAKGADKTEIQVNCWDLEPETEYVVLLCECDDGEVTDCIELGSFTANKKGKGRLHARVDGDYSNRCVMVGIEDTDTFVSFLVTAAIDLCTIPVRMHVGMYAALNRD